MHLRGIFLVLAARSAASISGASPLSERSTNIPAGSAGPQGATWRRTVGTTIALQWAVILGLALLAWMLAGDRAGRSLLLGGAAVAVPNALLAFWLTLRMGRSGAVGVVGMFAGELAKLALTLALLVMVIAQWRASLVWPGFLVGVIGALKAQWLALWFTRRM